MNKTIQSLDLIISPMKNISICIITLSIFHITFSFKPTYSPIKARVHANRDPLPKWKYSDNIIQNKQRIFDVSPDPNIVKVVIVGDIMMTRDGAKKIEENNNDYTFPFHKIKPELEGSDLKIANLEGGITDSSIIQKGITLVKMKRHQPIVVECHVISGIHLIFYMELLLMQILTCWVLPIIIWKILLMNNQILIESWPNMVFHSLTTTQI